MQGGIRTTILTAPTPPLRRRLTTTATPTTAPLAAPASSWRARRRRSFLAAAPALAAAAAMRGPISSAGSSGAATPRGRLSIEGGAATHDKQHHPNHHAPPRALLRAAVAAAAAAKASFLPAAAVPSSPTAAARGSSGSGSVVATAATAAPSSAATTAPAPPQPQQPPTDWRALVLLASLSVVLCYADRANLSTAILPMAEQYGWDDAFKGVVLSAFFAGYAATQVLGGSLADRHGGKRVLLGGVALWSVFTALTPSAAAAGAAPLLLVRALLGVGEGVAFPAIHALIAANVPRERQSTAVGCATAASYAGTALAFGLAPVVIATRGWPDVFHLFGASALLWLPFWLPVREKRKGVAVGGGGSEGGAGGDEGSPLLGGGGGATPKPSSSTSSTAALRRLWSRREVRAIAVCQYAQSYGMYGLLTWLPSFYSERYGVAVADLGGYTLLPYVLQGGLGLASGYLADRLIDSWSRENEGESDGGKAAAAVERRAKAVRRVRVSLQLGGMLGPAACLLFAVSPLAEGDPNTASAAVTLGLALSALTLGGVSASHLDVAPKHAGAVFGAGNTAATAAGLVATPLTGLVLRWTGGSWAWVFGLVAAHYLAGSVAWAAWAGDRPLPEDDDVAA